MLQLLFRLTNICVFFFVVLVNTERNYVLEFPKGNCYHNSSHIKALECSLRNDSNHQYLIDGRLELANTLEDFSIRAFMHVFRAKKQRITLFDLTLNGCELLSAIHKYRLLSVFVNTFKKYLNGIPKCPLKKDFNYTLTGLHFNVEDFPKFLPEAEFNTEQHVLIQNRIAAKIIFFGRVVYVKNEKA